MFWRRYRSAVVLSAPTGVAIGCAVAIGLYLGGNADYRTQGGWDALTYLLAAGALVGCMTALAALLGGVVVVLLTDRRLNRAPAWRVRSGAVGAAGGASALWLAVGLSNAPPSSQGAVELFWIVAGSGIAAVSGGVGALILLQRAERKAIA